MKRLRLFTLLGALLLSGAVMAAEVERIYEAEIPVAGQQNDARRQAMRAGLAEVLVRVTGNSAVVQDSAFADLLGNASRYVQQYRYRAAPSAGAPLLLWMSFDANAINQALRSRGQPIWGSARPLLLVWLAVDGGSPGRRLVGATQSAEYPGLEAAANRRGVPVRLPLLDIDEKRLVTVADVWGGLHERVVTASARYQAQGVLLGRLTQERQGTWSARWTLRIGNEVKHWDSHGASADEVLAKGVDGSADALALRFAQATSAAGGGVLSLRVSDIDALADYARVLSYLRGLNGVTAVQVDKVEPRAVTYRLSVQADTTAVRRVIGLGSTLAPADAMLPPDTSQPELSYRLLP